MKWRTQQHSIGYDEPIDVDEAAEAKAPKMPKAKTAHASGEEGEDSQDVEIRVCIAAAPLQSKSE